MRAIDQILSLASTYASTLGIEQSTVSWRAFGDTKKLKALTKGADIQVKRWEQTLQWFSDNWPDGAEWPASVPRPLATEKAA